MSKIEVGERSAALKAALGVIRRSGDFRGRAGRPADPRADQAGLSPGEGVAGRVERLEYDPNRSANLALVLYLDGEGGATVHHGSVSELRANSCSVVPSWTASSPP